MSVYETPELLPVFNKIILLQYSISALVGIALGYWFSSHQSTPLVEAAVTAFTSNVAAIDVRFDELNRYDEISGYFYIGVLIVAIPSAILGSICFITAYMKIGFLNGRTARFDSRSIYGLILMTIFSASMVHVSVFYEISSIGSHGRDGAFLAPFFAITLPCVTLFISGTILSAAAFLAKLIAHLRDPRPDLH